ncbi:MAG: magnesium transporter [Rubrimonas sp.]|uniref:magnesium transporter n=1 Tax=Rubrimonas sp. TaxID=2036015 RepID=UPI002FDED8C4
MTQATEPAEDRAELRALDDEEMLEQAARDVVAALDADDGAGDAAELARLLAPLHEADIADLIEQLDSPRRHALVEALDPETLSEVLAELEEGARDAVLARLDPARLAAAVRELDSDDIVYLVEDLDEEDQKRVLEGLDASDRIVVEQALSYPDYSAGRLMQREVVTAPPFWTVGQMIDTMRAREDLPETFYDVVVVDPAMKPVGRVSLARMLGARRPVTLGGIMEEDFRTVGVADPQEDVARLFEKYHLVSIPVVDEAGRLAGVITIDDAMSVLDDEAEEDLLRLGGVGDEEINDRVWETVRRRAPWLAVNLLTAILASLVIAIFDEVIAQVVALAVLMPIVASMGGNAGTQTLTVTVRALATRDLTATNALRVVGREALAGGLNGLIFALVIGGVGLAWYGDPMLGVVLGLAMVVNMLAAGLAGILIPMALDRVGADPALASGTFVTTVTDVVGFFAFLGLGALLLL